MVKVFYLYKGVKMFFIEFLENEEKYKTDQFGYSDVLYRQFIQTYVLSSIVHNKPLHGKINDLHMQKRHRSASL